MAKISYLSPVQADISRNNPAVISIESEYLENNQKFTLVQSAIAQNATLLKTDLQELKAETSSIYPFKVVVEKDNAGVSTIYTPNISTPVTASQNFYAALRFERYEPDIVRAINTTFDELQAIEDLEE